MASPLLVNLEDFDYTQLEYPIESIRQYIPHRFEMEQLNGVFRILKDERKAVGYRDVRDNEFWSRGHIPGRPLFPGVLMLEAGAQLATFMYKVLTGEDPNRFMGFGGLENVRFRGVVVPGDRLILIAHLVEARSRRCTFDVQGVVNGKLVFESRVLGLPV